MFWTWYRNEGTLSIHSITTQRREAYYWATVFATFALGTALGDFTADSLGMGYFPSGIFFFAVILVPALAWWRFGLNSIAAFWMAYIVTRPLGASFSDWISKPSNLTGLGFGNGQTAVVFAVATVLLVAYLAIARPDIQRSAGYRARRIGVELSCQGSTLVPSLLHGLELVGVEPEQAHDRRGDLGGLDRLVDDAVTRRPARRRRAPRRGRPGWRRRARRSCRCPPVYTTPTLTTPHTLGWRGSEAGTPK